MNRAERETRLLESILPSLEAEGYDVFLEPSPHLLPPFVKDYRPDAVAIGKPKNLAIELRLEGSSSNPRLEEIRKRFQENEDWELRIYYARPSSTPESVSSVSVPTIEASIREVEELNREGRTQLALLRAWATFEALGRMLLPGKFERPQTPGRLVEVLASEGHVTPTEAAFLRPLASHRNSFIHGNLDVLVDAADLDRFAGTLKEMCSQLVAQ